MMGNWRGCEELPLCSIVVEIRQNERVAKRCAGSGNSPDQRVNVVVVIVTDFLARQRSVREKMLSAIVNNRAYQFIRIILEKNNPRVLSIIHW